MCLCISKTKQAIKQKYSPERVIPAERVCSFVLRREACDGEDDLVEVGNVCAGQRSRDEWHDVVRADVRTAHTPCRSTDGADGPLDDAEHVRRYLCVKMLASADELLLFFECCYRCHF